MYAASLPALKNISNRLRAIFYCYAKALSTNKALPRVIRAKYTGHCSRPFKGLITLSIESGAFEFANDRTANKQGPLLRVNGRLWQEVGGRQSVLVVVIRGYSVNNKLMKYDLLHFGFTLEFVST